LTCGPGPRGAPRHAGCWFAALTAGEARALSQKGENTATAKPAVN